MATPTRWPPWIEPLKEHTATATINSTVAADLAGCTFTFTPHVNTRGLLNVVIVARLTAGGGDQLQVFFDVNGSPVLSSDAVNNILAYSVPAAALNEQATLSKQVHFDFTKETTYTVKVRAVLGTTAGGSSYSVAARRSYLGPLIFMPNLHV